MGWVRSLFWPRYFMLAILQRMNLKGAFAGVVVGALTVIIWPHLKPIGGIFKLYELLPGFIFASFAIILVSKATPAPESAIVNEFKHMKSHLQSAKITP